MNKITPHFILLFSKEFGSGHTCLVFLAPGVVVDPDISEGFSPASHRICLANIMLDMKLHEGRDRLSRISLHTPGLFTINI